jgi:hypothetical protein
VSARSRGLAGACVLAASVLLAVHAGPWRSRTEPADSEPRPGGAASSTERVPSAALAEETLERFERFRAGRIGSRLALGSAELSAVARYALPGIFPPGVVDPSVALEGERVRASALVVSAGLPGLPRLDAVAGLLPDTVLVELRGRLEPLDDDKLAFTVDRVVIGGVPLPRRMVPEMLAALGREDTAGLAADALVVPRPGGILSVVVQRDSLVMMGGHGATGVDRAAAEESG